MADVVLPAACFAEKDGTFTNTERRIQLVHSVLPPPGEAREDWRIVAEISRPVAATRWPTPPALPSWTKSIR